MYRKWAVNGETGQLNLLTHHCDVHVLDCFKIKCPEQSDEKE